MYTTPSAFLQRTSSRRDSSARKRVSAAPSRVFSTWATHHFTAPLMGLGHEEGTLLA